MAMPARRTDLWSNITVLRKAVLIFTVLAGLVGPVPASFIRFKPDTEYIYSFHSSTDLKKVRTLRVESKIGFVLVKRSNSDHQEIYLRVHSAEVTSEEEQVPVSEERNFDEWFSFDVSENGVIGHVYYPRDEDDHVILAKKGLTSLLASNLQHPPDGTVKENGWSYNCTESGHEGHHEASYTAQMAPGNDGIIVFTKTRHTHPIPYGKSKHQKEIHYHQGMQLPTMVKIMDHFDAPRKSTPGFEHGLQRSEEDKGEDFELPEMQSYSEGQLTFVREARYPSPTGPPDEEDIITDSIHLKMTPDRHQNFNLTELKEVIAGNLTCMRTASVKGPNDPNKCFQGLVRAFQSVPEGQLNEIVSPMYKLPLSRRVRDKQDRQNMMDAVAALLTDASLSLLTDLILLSPKPNKELVERLLITSAGFEHTVSEHFLATVEDIVFQPGKYPEILRHPETQRIAVMVLGALAGHQWKTGYKHQAESIILKIEDKLGVHDPWGYERTLTSLTEDEQEEFHHDTVALIEALGNAGLHRSFAHIESFTNSSATHPLLKRAGLHSMRNYHHDLAAETMLKAALDDNEDEHVRYEASLFYKVHPNGGKQNISKFISPEGVSGSNSSQDVTTTEVASVPSRHRVRRGFFDGIELKLASPSKDWKKLIGKTQTGAEFGLTIRNQLDMKIAPLSGHLRVDLYDEAYATVLVGLVGQKFDMARARFCFNGYIEYNLNILQEFGVDRINELTKLYDTVIGKVVGNIVRGVDIIVDLFNGDSRISELFDELVQTLEGIPGRISNVRSAAANAVARLSQFDPDQLPPSIRGVIGVVNKAAQLFSDIKTDVMEFYQAVNEAITVTLPWAAEQIWTSIISISDTIGDLLKSPLKAIGDIFKGIINIKTAVDAVIEAKMRVDEANFFKEGQRPYWFDLPKVISDMLRELREHLSNIKRDLVDWVKEIASSLDPIKRLTGGAVDSNTLRRQIAAEIEAIILDLIGPIEPIENLLAPFFELYDLVVNTIEGIKEAYLTLKNSYQESQALIMKLFGPKAHKSFPRKFREPGSGGCASGGFYPTDSNGRYRDRGVDLEIPPGIPLVAPFSGLLFKSAGTPNQVTLLARGGAFRNIKIYIDNIQPNSSLSVSKGVNVIAGARIGTVIRSTSCTPPNYIHFSMKNIKPNRLASILDSNLNDDPSPADDAAKEGYVDPTNYLAKRPLEIPQWIQVCDDYKLVWKGRTVKEGSLLNRDNKKGNKKNTSPGRKPPPNTQTTKPNPARKPPKQPSSLDNAVSSPEKKQETMEALDLPETKTGSGSPFKNFTLRNLKIGSILAFARKLGLEKTADDLLTVVKTIVKLVSDKPCVLPESLTTDSLRIELQQRGLSSQGDRETLIKRYKQPEDRCPLLQVSLPKNVYCKIDESCLGVECCMNVKVFMVSLAFKAFMRFDPCEFQFVLGVNQWNHTIQIFDAEFGEELEVPVPFDIPFIDDMEMRLRFGIEKSRTQLLVSMAVGFCPTTGNAECLSFIDVLKDSAIPLPICHPNGTFTWPNIDLEEYFSRAALKNLIKATGEELLQAGTEAALNYVLDELGIPREFLSDKEPCPTPTNMSKMQLIDTLEERQLAVTGTKTDLEARLSLDDRTCQFFTLPAFPPELAKVAYCSLSDNCLRLDCCLELNIENLKFRRSFKAFVEVDACDFTFYVSFQHLQYKKLLLSYEWGRPEEQNIGDAITLRYSINKLDAQKEFEIDFGASICSGSDDCIFDLDIIQDYRVPIPFCNSNFSFSLPGGDTLKDFVTQVGRNAGQQAVNIFLEYIGLRDKINDGPCDTSALVGEDEEECTAISLPSLPAGVTCELSHRCLGIRCCAELDLRVTILSVNTWLILDPCEFTLSMGFGKWSLTFTIFDYHWGTQEELKIGKALTLIYTIDKLTEDKVFVLDLALSLCLPESECDTPSIDILRKTRVPIPLCNENATFTLPGDGTIKGFLQTVGQNAAESAVDAILEYLGLSKYISREPCVRPQVTQNGWQRLCPRDVRLPRLPKNLVCTLPEKCLGFDCCLELPIPGITTISTQVSFIFDPCNYRLSLSLGSWSLELQVLSYQWGQQEEVPVGKPITLSVTIDKLDAEESFRINLDISICIDSDCTTTPVLQDSLVPIPFCNLNASFQLPGDGSFAGLARELAGNVGELAIQAGLQKLGIQQYVSNQQCDMELLAPSENKCPLLRLPPPTNFLTCKIDDRCLGLTCCASLDLIFTQLSTTAWAVLDPCEFQLSVGLGSWSENLTLFEYDWGVDKVFDISDSVRIEYNVDKLTAQKEFLIDLSVVLCIDGSCRPIHLLQAAHVPIPICNPNATFTLPGDGTISGYLESLGGQVTDAAIDLVLEYLNLKNFLSRNPCTLPPALPTGDDSCPVQFPDTPPQLLCRIGSRCTSLHCCLNLDIKVTQISSRAWFIIDPCDYTLSVGLELWFFNTSLFSYEWGTLESFMIGDALDVRFTIDKLDATKEYEVDLSFSFRIDGVATDFPLMADQRIPIPICNANFSLELPGDGSVKGFLKELGDNVGQAAIQLVLQKLNLQDVISGETCDIPPASATDCPMISLPFLENVVKCSIDNRCLGIQCCITLDFVITELMLSARLHLDPCNFQLFIAFENWNLNVTLFSYTWGKVETVDIGNAMAVSFTIDKLTARKVFSVTLNLMLCIDDTCTTTPVLDRVWVPIPLCNTNATSFTLPGDGTVEGFIRELGGRIGNSAIDLVLEKFGLSEYLNTGQCNMGTPGTLKSSCPAVGVTQLPDFLSCTVADSCLGIRCCLEIDLKITTRSVTAWVTLDPCNFTLSVGFEKWERSVTLFHYPLGDVMEEVVNEVLRVRWRVAKITEDKQFEVDLSLVICIDGACDTLTILEGSRLPIPLCNTEDSFTLPGDGTISGFLSYLGGNIGQFAVDAALRHLNLANFLTGKACSYHRQDVCASSTSILGNCSLIGETCTELRCCLELDLKIADVSATAWFKFDPCDFTFTLGLEKWSFHGSVFSYQWGEEMTESIASGMTLRYSINKRDDTKEFEISVTLEYCIDGLCTDIDIQHNIPIPVCNPDFRNYTLSADGFIETVSGQIIQGATLALLSRLGIDPDFFSSQPCVNPSGPQSFGNCPSMQLPSNLTSLAHCGILDSCFGVECCLDINLGPLIHSFSASMVIDPCLGQLTLQFGNWQYSKSLSHLDFDTSQEVTIGNFITLRYTLELMNSKISVNLSVDACIDGHCTGEIMILDGAVSPLPMCYPNGTISWRNLPGITSVSQLGSLDAGFEAVATALGLPPRLVSASPCPPVIQPSQSGVCPHLPTLPTLPSGGVCHYSDACLGVECCLAVDLGIISRTLRAWLTVDPCDFKLSVGFENWSYNVTLLSYKWGKVTRERLSDAVSLTFTLDKTADNRNFLLSLSLQLCIAGVCAPDLVILQDFTAPIPFCNPNGTLEWAQDLVGDIGDYASGLVVNRLSVSADVLLPQPCSGPPEQITPATTGCSSPSLPSSIAQYCSLDQSCLGVGCCLNFDLGVVQRSFSVWVKLDPCARTFSFGFEKWSHIESLGIQLLQSHSFEKNLGVLKIRYDVERPHNTVYDVDLDISLCWQGVCDEPVIILRDAMFSGPDCSGGSSTRRRRRSVDDLSDDSAEGIDNMDLTANPIDKARDYFKALLNGSSTSYSAEDNAMTKLQPDKVVKPTVADSGTASRRSMGLLVFGEEEETPPTRRRRRDLSVSVTSGGASLFDLSLTPGADSGTWQGDVIVGGGLTQKGLDALGRRIANMTIGELEAMLDLQNIDPFTVVQLMKDLRSLFRTFVEELIDVFTEGIAEDNFQQFDIVLSGTISFPRVNAVYFRYEYRTLLGGLIWLEFIVESGGFFEMQIPVSVSLVSMRATGGAVPSVGAYARATVAICYGLCGEMELTAEMLRTSFPTTAEIFFSKFPLDVGLKLDVEMIPLTIVLKGKVTIRIPFFGKKTLFQKDLYRYQASKISSNIFYIQTKDPDPSPPEISEYSTEDGVSQSSAGGNNCGIEQVPGLDYTEPAFQLEMVAADDKSLVTFFYQVGTAPGGSDVLSKTEFGGPSAIISQILLGGHPLHFTVYAMNNGGGTATATCSLPTFDVTLPTGRITPDFTSTSHPHILRASAVVYDDSVILMQKEGVGFGPEIWGDQIVPWHTVDFTERENVGPSVNDFHSFTAAKLGRLISTPTSTIIHRNPNFCARDCLALPETKCLSINYNYGDFTCELLEEIEGHGVEVRESGLFSHFERLGVGHAVEFNHESLGLVHNNLYYFNIELLNFVAYENIISSVAITADFTPPEPGLIINRTRDEVVHEPCVDFTPEEWERRCIEDTPLDNHRYISDGPGSMTVFNGHEELVDMLYTRSNTFMAANWEGFHDNETGIHGYTWSIGYDVCDDDVSMHIDPHAHLFDESEWTHQGLVVNVNLPDGAYFITVRALNKVQFGGPMALTVCHSTPLVIDNTPPIIYGIHDITYDSSIGRIGLQVNATDPDSHLFEYHLAAGRTPRDKSLRDWEAHVLAEQLFMDFKIPNGIPCWLKVRAVNNVDLRTIDHADEPILVDDSPPIAGDLFDGPYAGRDLVFTKDRNEICANWYNWYDPESGISSYLWAVGTQPSLSNVVDYIKVSRREHSACSGYVTLQHGETYYSTLVAFHGGYDKLNVSASSDGVTVDLTPPIQGSVYDGLLPGPTDLEFSSKPATVEAQWEGFSDPDSGIEDYQVTVYRKHNSSSNVTNDFEVIHKAESVGRDTSSIEWHHFHLKHKDQVYVNLRTINQALNHIDTPTNGFLVDLTPPNLRTLGDGLVYGEDADFQSHSDSLAVHWDYFDDESGIESFELAIYEMRQGNKIKIFPADSDPNSFELISDVNAKSHMQTGLMLRGGSIYITRLKARNQAKLVASHETSGIRVDPTPPVMRYVRGGNLDGEIEEVIYGYLYQNSHSTIQASWLAVDGQSGIKSYWVAIGTAPNSEDIQPFTSRGPKGNSVLSNLDLQLTDPSTCSDEAFTEGCQPVYYVCVKSENGAGAFSDVVCSSPIRIVEEDQTGYVTDGPSMLQDVDAQHERTTVTIWFDDFESQLHGISHYEWAVGTTPGGEDIQPLTSDGIVPGSDEDAPGLAGKGKAQSPLPLQHGMTYYSTLRAITNGDNVLESTSNGFTVDITPPEIMITDLGQYDASVDLSLEGGIALYQPNTDSIDGTWEVSDEESGITATYFSMGQYPGGSNVYPVTQTNKSYVPLALITPSDIGLPNILTVQAINSVGLKRTVYTTSITADNTPPSVGQVHCPAFIHANSALLCSWSDFLDAESGIDHFHLFVGSAQGLDDVFQSGYLPGHLSHYSVKDLNLIHNKVYYVTVEAFNAVNQSTTAFSGPIEIDDTPPSYGLVVELPGVYTFNFSDPVTLPEWDCTDEEECLRLDGECLESLTQLQILWQAFTDEDTQITKYEVALGTTPGGSQVKPFYEVAKDQTSELISNIDLSDIHKVYATVRGYNEAGLTSTAVSNGIYVSRFSAGLQPLRPFEVKDGVDSNDMDDSDFQTALQELSAAWDFSGDPCPMKKYEWAIYRIDGQEIQPLTDVGEQTSDSNTDVNMIDDETYYTVVRATNALGLAVTVRSDGITVKREPLIPGQVYDGLLVGFDLTYQKETDTISASWKGFGKGTQVAETVEHTGNAEVNKGQTTQQTVDFYEAAVGTDRRYPKTRDNVVPFTYMGQNTSVTFRNLDLTALDSTYYVTVRGHSASFSTAEVTSTGIKVGVDTQVIVTEVEVPDFVNSLSEVKLQWDKFESTVPILLYYVGLGKPSPSVTPPEDMDCLDMLLVTPQSRATFSERSMHFVGKDTFVELKGLNLTQEGSYYVTAVGMNEAGQCNASTSYFSIDVTPPTEGRLRAGPFYDMLVTYTDSDESVSVVWEDYKDDESGIKSFNLRLMQAASCDVRDDNNLTPVPDQDWLVLGPGIRDHTFVDLNLEMNHPYYVQLLAVNQAGDSVQTQVGPIFVDLSEPTVGLVADGMDFKMDITDSGDRSQVSGTILHLPNPVGPACPLRDIPFTDPQWSALDFKGLWNMNRDKWDLEYHSQQVFAANESLTLKMERDTRGPRMLSGAYVTNAQIVRSSEYEFDLKAASSELHSVTSILFWDGPDGVIGEFDFGGRENWQEGICQCCYTQPLNQSACPLCDCLDFLGISDPADSNTTVAIPTVKSQPNGATTTEAAQGLIMTTAKVPWSIERPDEDGDSISDDKSGRWIPQRACGFQLYPNGNKSQAVLWCRYFEDDWPMTSNIVDLDYDPSVEERHYSINFRVMPFDADEDEWSFEVNVDGKLLSSVTGVPVMSSSTKLILHVFNRNSYIPELLDPFSPPSVTATLRNLRMPPDQSKLCRYGASFRAGTSPVSRYFAGVGSVAGATDIVAFQEFGRPCVPCISPCDRYQCDPSCSMDAVAITFTLTDLHLPRLELLNGTSVDNDTNATMPAPRQDGLQYPFFLTVKTYLGNGKTAVASSNGFYIDDTPAQLDVFFYTDPNFNEFEPTTFQSSGSTIKVLWSFVDLESDIKEHYWAIGTSRGATDLQDFVNVGLNQTAISKNLTGVLQHNTTYYVTLKAVNGAGLEAVVECDGITVLLEEPTAEGVNTTSMFSEKFEEEIFPPDVEKSSDPSKTGTSWSESSDKSVARYEYCVSSSAELLEDIVPCMVVGGNSSGSVAIEDGVIIVRAGDREERYSLTDFQIPKDSTNITDTPPKFNMEPGKTLHTWMRVCNAAKRCVTKSAGTTTILEDSDMMMTSTDGTDLVLASPTIQRRRKRAVDNHFDFTLATTGGLHQGGSLLVGLLDVNRTNQEFTSDASLDYKPYITDPLNTIPYTSRLLRQRIRFVYEPTFYVTSLGQTELRGPMVVSLTLSAPGSWTDAKPRLIYWNVDQSEWQDAAKTCSEVDKITYNDDANQVNVEVCSTRSSASPPSEGSRRRRATDYVTFFSRETQFALVQVTSTIPNNAPEITNLPDNFFMNEDEGTLVYTLQASDPEDDILIFELVPNGDMRGEANITQEGVLSFTPCLDCQGTFTLQVTVREVQSLLEITPLSTTVAISINVQPVNDNPVLYIAQDGNSVGNGRMALLTVEQNTGFNVAYKDLSFQLGAFDPDISDNLTIVTQLPSYGTLRLARESKAVPTQQNCHQSSGADDKVPAIPCGLDIPHEVEDMSWTTSTFTYTPNSNYHGRDSFRVLVEDRSQAVSQLLEVQIAVLVNPCINEGICRGPAEDPDCTSPERSNGFDSYSCICEPGWVGEICQTDLDECQSIPCEYPYVCYDRLDGYDCACPLTDPVCDDLHWRVKVVLGVVCSLLILFVIAAVVFFVYKKRYIKSWSVSPEPDDDGLPAISHEIKENSTSTAAADMSMFVVSTGECKHVGSDGDNQAGTSNVGDASSERPKSTASVHSSGSGSSASSSGSSKRSGKKSKRPLSGLGRSNAIGDSSLIVAKDSEGHDPGRSTSVDPSPSVSPTVADKWAEPTLHTQSSGSLKNDANQSGESPDAKPTEFQQETSLGSDTEPPDPQLVPSVWVEPPKSTSSLKKKTGASKGEEMLLFEKRIPRSDNQDDSDQNQPAGSRESFKDFRDTDLLMDIDESHV
ncbi:uncharacterized protein LOC110985344 [Acanthaster planci]|uniref:Uncharacterized protein LOC110985344 n=1 Tax=Acanthaster planci TaxID=133434 RepID=A0A8B7ZFJ3_ACAPL|nr:uncharacterized protein LOC110985344 [Acanthaster planci]